MKKIIYFLLGLIGIIACSNETNCEDITSIENPLGLELRSASEAINVANSIYSKFYQNKTRAGEIESIEQLGNFTKTEDNSMYGYYVINYGEESGFSIISADKRREIEVLAISDKGSLHLSDTIDNNGLDWYLNNYINTLSLDPIPPVIEHDSIVYKPELIDHYCEPLLTGQLTEFHQYSPFNRLCFTAEGKRAVVGCVPLAAGTIMAYYKWPEYMEGNYLDWDAMLNDIYHPSWPIFFEILGREKNTGVTYGTDVTGTTNPGSVVKTFENYQYTGMASRPFSSFWAKRLLQTQMPLIILGEQPGVGGHMYIMDGGYTMKMQIFYQGSSTSKVTEYFHCIWGNGGEGNGYFAYVDDALLNSEWNPIWIYYGFTPVK